MPSGLVTCAVFLLCALGIHWVNREEIGKSVVEESVLPADPNPGTPPAQPPANGEEKPK